MPVEPKTFPARIIRVRVRRGVEMIVAVWRPTIACFASILVVLSGVEKIPFATGASVPKPKCSVAHFILIDRHFPGRVVLIVRPAEEFGAKESTETKLSMKAN